MADANEQDILDDALQAFTHEAMKEVVAKYAGMDIPDLEKKVELEVCKIISPWIPEKFTEVDVKAIMGRKYSSVIAEYMTDGATMMVVVYDSPMSKITIGKDTISYKVPNGDFAIKDDGTIHINNLPTQIKAMIEAPMKLGISSKGCGSTPEERLAVFKERHGNHPMSEFNGWDEDGNYQPDSLSEDYVTLSDKTEAKIRAYEIARTYAEEYGKIVDDLSVFTKIHEPRGSKVETLPDGKGLGKLSDIEYFKKKIQEATGVKPEIMERGWNPDKMSEAGISSSTMSQRLTDSIYNGDPVKGDYADNPVINWHDGTKEVRYTADYNPYERICSWDLRPSNTIKQKSYSNKPEVAKTNNLGVVDNPNLDWTQMSSVNMDSAMAPFDAKGTSGWTEEYTITSSHDDSDLVWYNPYGNDMSNLEEINFTIEELDELVDLLDDTTSKVMKF